MSPRVHSRARGEETASFLHCCTAAQAPVILCLVMNEFLEPSKLIALGMLKQLATLLAIDAGSTACRILPENFVVQVRL